MPADGEGDGRLAHAHRALEQQVAPGGNHGQRQRELAIASDDAVFLLDLLYRCHCVHLIAAVEHSPSYRDRRRSSSHRLPAADRIRIRRPHTRPSPGHQTVPVYQTVSRIRGCHPDTMVTTRPERTLHPGLRHLHCRLRIAPARRGRSLASRASPTSPSCAATGATTRHVPPTCAPLSRRAATGCASRSTGLT